MSDKKWHDIVLGNLKVKLKNKGITYYNLKLKHFYKPDIVCKKDGKILVFEVERYANDSKMTHNIIFSWIGGANELIIIFNNNDGKGDNRKAIVESIYQTLQEHIKCLSLLKLTVFWNTDGLQDFLDGLLR